MQQVSEQRVQVNVEPLPLPWQSLPEISQMDRRIFEISQVKPEYLLYCTSW